MKLYIKYMVSLRCKTLVKEDLEKLGLRIAVLDFGLIEILGESPGERPSQLKDILSTSGWEVLDNQRSVLIERIKGAVADMIQRPHELGKANHSEYLSKKLGYSYTYLNNTFSETKAVTIQQFIILQKIEKVKELILYSELSLTEIAHQLRYSNIAHLSNQFKKVTGLSPSYYKQLKKERLVNQDDS